jgi:hypothetical protein
MVRWPDPPTSIPSNIATYLRDVGKYVQMALRARTPDSEAHHSVILLSPNGSAWEITVDDAGVLTTTKVQE